MTSTPPTNSDAPAAPDENETRLLLSVTVRKQKSDTEMERLSTLTGLPQATLDTLSSGGSIQLFHIPHHETSNLPFLIHFVPWITENRFSLTHTSDQPSNEASLWLHYTDLMNGWYSMRLDFRRPILSPLSDDVFCTSRNINIATLCDKISASPSNLIHFKSVSELGEDAHQPCIGNLVIPDTVSILPCDQPPEPFALKLYDYQLRTLAWMQGIEDGLDEYYYCPGVKKLCPEGKFAVQTTSNRVDIKASIEDVRTDYPTVRAGIIADKPGVGKTITSLALVHTRPCTDPDYLYSVSPNGKLKSRATVFFVPNNICSQWMTEIKKCFGSNIKAIEIKGKIQYDKVSLKQVLECDILVVSYHFLVNKHNISAKLTSQDRVLVSRFPEVDFFNKDAAKAFVDERTSGGGFSLSWIHFHRVVYDEFHEITDKNKALQTQLLLMAGDTMWGLTGTPRLGDGYVVCRFADYLKVKVNYIPPVWELQPVGGYFLWKEFYAKDFVLNRVRRNEPEITYPPPIYETIRVTQTAMEYPLYQSCVGRKANTENLVKLCNHYQIANGVVADGSHALTIEQVTEIVQKDRAKRIKMLTQEIKKHQKTLEGQYDLVLNAVSMNAREDAERMYRKAMRHDQEIKEELRSTQSQFNFFDNFLNSYAANNDTISCIVCLEDDVPRDSLGLAPCGHVFCWECAEKVAKVVRTCPHCKAAMTPEKLMKLQPPANAIAVPESVEETGDGDTLDPDKFGSKIRELVQYLQREMDADTSHRFLVFIQWSDLADLVTQALNTFGIVTARLKNGFQHREAALRQFRAGLESEVAKNETIGSACVEEREMVQELDDFEKENSEGEEYQPGEDDEFGSDSKRKRKRATRRVGKEKKKPTSTSKRNPPSRVLILSAKDSVSGLNLTEATHCIILHPFHDIKEAHAVGAEKQGVARTLRNGQTKTVKIVRLVVENTIEQDMHDRRAPTMTLNDVI
ncbi:hypothetical protein HDU80_007487 [Chytriomyces hyalinus]|nr:hypothetical protein HDU80_007487 [Chytriomyces hyalinus]